MWPAEAKQTQATFLDETWRRRALVFAEKLDIAPLAKRLTESELANLAKQDIVESRIISANKQHYEMEFGPFSIDTVAADELLMIQSLEAYYDEIADFIARYFAFLPRWRIDDVMASYGHEGANCGAHFDHYDVFLVQVRGQKHWSLDNGGHTDLDLDETADVRLLKQFAPTWQTIQGPGDILYIPPGVGHHGIASKDSLTLSVGIRNPTASEMISHLADYVAQDSSAGRTLDNELYRLSDASSEQTIREPTGDFSKDLILRLQKQLSTVLLDEALLSRWYGVYMTEPREPDVFIEPTNNGLDDEEDDVLRNISRIDLHLATRLAYTLSNADVTLFVNGQAYSATAADLVWFLPLQNARTVSTNSLKLDKPSQQIISQLLDQGALVIPDITPNE
ncbi:MAG: cupin domain-containing protein [Pseudomonadales bacterium]|nr:cupin domain-containing protein [Pseudomonadales bacterium]MDG1443939.1 cupin domain-containing protein [Pseudomonadales bacterium]